MISVIKNSLGITTHLFAILLLLAATGARANLIVEHVQVGTTAASGHLSVLGGAAVDDIAVGTALSRELTDLILASRPEFTGVYHDLLVLSNPEMSLKDGGERV